MSDIVHVYHTSAEHVTEGLGCWCVPVYLVPCDECTNGCWKCTGGTIELTRAAAESEEARLIVVHNR